MGVITKLNNIKGLFLYILWSFLNVKVRKGFVFFCFFLGGGLLN